MDINGGPATQPARCRKCRRPLRTAESVARGIGPTCLRHARTEALRLLADYTAEQIGNALELITDGGLVQTGRAGVWNAVSSKGDEVYLVHVRACNCTGGRRSRKACYHTAAIRMLTRTPVIPARVFALAV